jgi:hypothetical protein
MAVGTTQPFIKANHQPESVTNSKSSAYESIPSSLGETAWAALARTAGAETEAHVFLLTRSCTIPSFVTSTADLRRSNVAGCQARVNANFVGVLLL